MRLHQRIRRGKLQGEQLDISFPRRGRPSRFRRLERAGQMRLELQRGTTPKLANCAISQFQHIETESPEAALDYLFPVGPMSEDQLYEEFMRVFPLE